MERPSQLEGDPYAKFADFIPDESGEAAEAAARAKIQTDRFEKHRTLSRFKTAGPDQRSASRMKRRKYN